MCERLGISERNGGGREKGLADKTGAQHARCVQGSLRLVECCAGAEPRELVP